MILTHGEDEAQINRHRLLHGEKVERQLINFALGIVDGGFAGEHHLAELAVAGAVRFVGAIDGLLCQTAHPQQFLLQFVESLLKAAAHYPNLPVM